MKWQPLKWEFSIVNIIIKDSPYCLLWEYIHAVIVYTYLIHWIIPVGISRFSTKSYSDAVMALVYTFEKVLHWSRLIAPLNIWYVHHIWEEDIDCMALYVYHHLSINSNPIFLHNLIIISSSIMRISISINWWIFQKSLRIVFWTLSILHTWRFPIQLTTRAMFHESFHNFI